MTNDDKNIPKSTPGTGGADNKASHDLRDAAEEAMRLLKQAQESSKEHKVDETVAAKVSAEEAGDDTLVEELGSTTNDLQQEALKALKLQAERAREAAAAQARPDSSERARFDEQMQLKLHVQESGEAILKDVNHELIVGRADNVTDYIPDIDLTPHGAYRLGLSRRHAIILRDGEKLLVKDLNSRNGTFVNGTIVAGGSSEIIRDGDELRFGNLSLRVSFEKPH